jgi:hypothetical protein
MVFFDYLFYAVYKFYATFNEKSAESTSAGIVGGLITMNVLTFGMLIEYLTGNNAAINKLTIIGVFLFFQVCTYIRYLYRSNHSIGVIEIKWNKKSKSQRASIETSLFLYVLLSIVSLFGLAIYIGSLK